MIDQKKLYDLVAADLFHRGVHSQLDLPEHLTNLVRCLPELQQVRLESLIESGGIEEIREMLGELEARITFVGGEII